MTFMQKKEAVTRNWYVIDAKGESLGRVAAKAAHILRGMERAVKGMLPHNRLGRAMYKKLFVYEGETHPHMAQKPEVMSVK